jgi:hypothetical protein
MLTGSNCRVDVFVQGHLNAVEGLLAAALLPRRVRNKCGELPYTVSLFFSFYRPHVPIDLRAMSASKGRVLLAYSGGLGEWLTISRGCRN